MNVVELVEIAGLKNQLLFLDICIVIVLILLFISMFEKK